jgi:hypothetical protein
MALSVGPIQSYVPGSTWFDLTQYSNLGLKEQVSINLSSSNLWLVDSSQLALPYNYAPRLSVVPTDGVYPSNPNLQPTGVLYTEGITFADSSTATVALPNVNTSLGLGAQVQTSAVQGSGQLDAVTTASGIFQTGSPGLSTGYQTSSSSSSSLSSLVPWASSTSSGSQTAGANSQTTSPRISGSNQTTVNQGNPGASSSGTIVTGGNPNTPQTPPTSNSVDSNPTSPKPVPAPFEIHSTLGLLIVLGIVAGRRSLRFLLSRFDQPMRGLSITLQLFH